MIFNSLSYALFLLLVVTAYWGIKNGGRQWIIFIASITFYGFWRLDFVLLLLFSTALDFFVAKQIEVSEKGRKKFFLLLSLCTNLGLLIVFKYLYFIHDNITGLFNLINVEIPEIAFEIILPLGISFYTFQTISYTIDVYRGHLDAEQNFIGYGCYVLFFPQLIAGPVLRAGEIIPQFKAEKSFNFDDFYEGLKRIIYGLFLKVVVADNIAPFVDEGFLIPTEMMSAWDVWTLSYLFGFQIYFDFSAYSHIALGTARLFGIRFPENFNYPYAATDPKDFWKRWHISLSSWIRDYLYLPLIGAKVIPRSEGGLGNQVVENRQSNENKGLFLSWGIMGLWHGANWNFLIWGLYHATVIYGYRKFKERSKRVAINTKIACAMTMPIMMLGWVPFRAESVDHTMDMWLLIVTPASYQDTLGMRENAYLIGLLLVLGFLAAFRLKEPLFSVAKSEINPIAQVTGVLFFACLLVLVLIFMRPVSQFIYFQF